MEQRRELRALPYLNWTATDSTTTSANGVITHQVDAAHAGWNLYNSRPRSRAVLMDMDGNEIHAWENESPGGWHHIELCDDGSLLTIVKDESLTKLDWNSQVVWSRDIRAHHDIAVTPQGDIYTLTRYQTELTIGDYTVPILDDNIEILSADGQTQRQIPMSKLMKGRVPVADAKMIRKELKKNPKAEMKAGSVFDVFHTNSIEIVDEGVLISLRELDLVAVVDLELGRVMWTWGPGEIEYPHQPSRTPEGNILIFDNGTRREYSRIVEVDPQSGNIVWEYDPRPKGDFYSSTRGGCQLLPNGNVLITESNKGRVFEITRDGQVVWDFFNLDRKGEKRASIYRMTRIEPERLAHLIPQ